MKKPLILVYLSFVFFACPTFTVSSTDPQWEKKAEQIIDFVQYKTGEYKRMYFEDESLVLPGVDVCKADDFSVLKNKRVGLITNQTGKALNGTPTAKLLADTPDVKLVAIFSPEHGFNGDLEKENVEDSNDPATGVKVYSLYGTVRKPTPEMLNGIDVLVFDIQDIGTRFYTYVSTMLGAMEAAAKAEITFVVFDRPNPIRGDLVQGPMLQSGRETFVGCFRMPIRHGMTPGELALMMNIENRIGVDLHVVPCVGWLPLMDFSETEIPWVNPSPNMRSLTAAYLYSGIGLLEFTNISVGRGTETPFELIGAPWLDGEKLAAKLRELNMQGIEFESVRFMPELSQFEKTECGGVRFTITDKETFHPVRLGLSIATLLRDMHPDKWEAEKIDTLLLWDEGKQLILDGKSIGDIEEKYELDLEKYINDREQYRLYCDCD